MDAFDGLLRDALVTTAAIALPMLAVAALVGTAVAVVQAATQVQEQTLTLLPKILAVGAMVATFGVPAMHLVADLFARAITAIPAVTGGS
jgi:flagellar biosynthesis protein FliQ